MIFGMDEAAFLVLVVVIAALTTIMLIAGFARRYIKVPPNKVLVVYGRKDYVTQRIRDADGKVREVVKKIGYKLYKGGATFIWPIIEKTAWMSLDTHTVEVEVPEVITQMGVPLTVEGVAQVKIKSDDVSIRTAAEQLLDKHEAEIIEIARKTLEGHIRGTCATLTIESINADRAALSQKIQEEAVPDFDRLGMQITIFVIKDIKDRVGYLDALGKKRTAEVKRDAEIGSAQALRDQAIQVAAANKDGEVGKAVADRDRVIGVYQAARDGAIQKTAREAEIAEAEKERDVKKAGYLAEVKTKEAERDLAYDIRSSTQKQELIRQAMQVEIEKKKKEVELQDTEVRMQERAQIATQVVPAQKQADSVAATADGEKRRIITVSEGKRGEYIMLAEGEAKRLALTGQGEADRIRAIADAEAYRIRATGEAEATKVLAVGTAESKAMQLKAESWKQYHESAKLQMIIEKLPEIANALAKPLENTQKIIIMGNEGSSGLVRSSTDAIAKVPAVVEALTGVKMLDLVGSVADAVRGNRPPPASPPGEGTQ